MPQRIKGHKKRIMGMCKKNFPIKRFFGTFDVGPVNGDKNMCVWLQKILTLIM